MNERKIIDRMLLSDLATEVRLNASHLEALGESRQWEIVVGVDMLERMVEIQHQFEYIKSIGVETFDFNSIEDDIIKTVAYIWRINDYLASDTVILLHRVYVLWSRNWKQHSIISLLNAFFEAVLYYKIKNEPNAFNLGYTNVSDLIRRAKLCEGFESSRRLAVAYCYLLKNPPKMNADQEEFFMA